MGRRTVLGLVIGLVVVVGLVSVVQRLGGVVRRPEGAAERFLQAVAQDEGDDVARYGTPDVARALTDFRRKGGEDDWFRRIEVGRATRTGAPGERVARVPFKFVRNDEADTKVAGVLVVRERAGEEPRPWGVAGASADRRPGERVPSEGGRAPASAAGSSWLLGLAIAVALAAGLEALLRVLGGPAPNLTQPNVTPVAGQAPGSCD